MGQSPEIYELKRDVVSNSNVSDFTGCEERRLREAGTSRTMMEIHEKSKTCFGLASLAQCVCARLSEMDKQRGEGRRRERE